MSTPTWTGSLPGRKLEAVTHFRTVRTFTQTCEEALVKLAFSQTGCSIDYISMEIARRWSRWLGLASFTYHAPGPYALRLWGTSNCQLQ